MGPLVQRLQVPLAGLCPSLAPEEAPFRGIIDPSSQKSTLRTQGSSLNSPSYRPPPRFSMTGIRKVTPHFYPSSPPGLQVEGWIGWGRCHHSMGPLTNLEFEPEREQTAGGNREENDLVQAPGWRKE